MQSQKIYLDNNATTKVDQRVLEAVVQEIENSPANPSSVHSFGQEAKSRLTNARRTVASFLNVKPQEIIFTSGGTEGANMLIRGLLSTHSKPGHIITSLAEHHCVYAAVKLMETLGYEATYLQPGLWGAVKPEDVRAALRPNTQLITLMAANNETGVKTDLEAIGRIAAEAGIPFFVDGVAFFGKEPFSIPAGVSGMCVSGHKFHALQGTGFVFLRNGVKLHPLLVGGEQEFAKRAGTENLPGIIGLAAAIEILKHELPETGNRIGMLRDRLEQRILSKLDCVFINGDGPRVPNTTNLSFEGVEGELLMARLDLEGICVSHGSACSSGALEPSRVLLNMGISRELARSSIRFSLSRFTTEDEVDFCIQAVIRLIQRFRNG
jgi:cysteine desulfurase